jgi:hypothetical protein
MDTDQRGLVLPLPPAADDAVGLTAEGGAESLRGFHRGFR